MHRKPYLHNYKQGISELTCSACDPSVLIMGTVVHSNVISRTVKYIRFISKTLNLVQQNRSRSLTICGTSLSRSICRWSNNTSITKISFQHTYRYRHMYKHMYRAGRYIYSYQRFIRNLTKSHFWYMVCCNLMRIHTIYV